MLYVVGKRQQFIFFFFFIWWEAILHHAEDYGVSMLGRYEAFKFIFKIIKGINVSESLHIYTMSRCWLEVSIPYSKDSVCPHWKWMEFLNAEFCKNFCKQNSIKFCLLIFLSMVVYIWEIIFYTCPQLCGQMDIFPSICRHVFNFSELQFYHI